MILGATMALVGAFSVIVKTSPKVRFQLYCGQMHDGKWIGMAL